MNTAEAIRTVRFFHGLPDEQCAKLADIAVIRTSPRDALLFESGAEASGFFAVLTGRVKIFRTSPSGKEHILHVFGPGEMFGEVAVFQGSTFPASAQTLEESDTLFIPRRDFRDMLGREPDMALKMMALLAGRLRTLVNKVDDLTLKETPSRVAAYLLLLRSSHGTDTFKLDLPKGQIAFYLGTIQETLSRIFKRFADEELIELRGKEITILDQDGLQDLADEGR
ncbi:Crp/Fnr family transcriptional regulator [Pseudodesulfovibrio sp.]|uniref:Crp/Fnr family transcriptional regulator n=1 Tax=Pseudodesulfovibrio sp. TaxID=2035812 RepID=UPI002630016C|nr:Crp/Fnr family transcriptional regulator [Pseudodesulfovibrio sp.]MDD3313093.1 Crp/Fnr family transcriptional regulator [Pseudodesulfovibrio sp.]